MFYSNQIRNSLFGAYYPNFTTQIIEGKLVVDDIFSENNNGSSILSKGDIISKIEGVPTGKYIDSLGTFFSSSTMQALERDINPYLLRGHTDFINITFSHNGKIETGKFARVLKKKIGKVASICRER